MSSTHSTVTAHVSFSEWTSWSTMDCPVTCGGGEFTRTRSCVAKPGNDVLDASYCGGSASETKACSTEACPCKMTHQVTPATVSHSSFAVWEAWSTESCPVSCGGADITRTRACHDGDTEDVIDPGMCSGEHRERLTCNDNDCPCMVHA